MNTYAAYHVLWGTVDPYGEKTPEEEFAGRRGWTSHQEEVQQKEQAQQARENRDPDAKRRKEQKERQEASSGGSVGSTGTGETNALWMFWQEWYLFKYEADKKANLECGRGLNEFWSGTLAFLDTAPVFSTGSRGADALHGERLQGVDYGEPLSGLERGLEGGEFVFAVVGPLGKTIGVFNDVSKATEAASDVSGTVKKVKVTSWADEGVTPDLASGRWVMIGEKTRWNYFKTGLCGPKVDVSKQLPFFKITKSKSSFDNAITGEIPITDLKLPPGWEIIKTPLGQRIIKSSP